MKKIIALSLFSIFFLPLFAQQTEKTEDQIKLWNGEKKWKASVNLGMPFLGGDADKIKAGYNLGVDIRRTISQSFGVRLYGGLGQLNGARGGYSDGNNNISDGVFTKKAIKEDYTYKNNFLEASVDAVFIVSALDFDGDDKRDLQAYYGAGIGLWRNNVVGEFTDPALYGLTEQPRLKASNAMVPIFFGLMKNINENIDIELEYKYRYLRSDMVDGFAFNTWTNRNTDFVHTLNIRAAFKLGMDKGYDHSDWINVALPLIKSVKESNEKVASLGGDSDGDGVADLFDAETTEAGLTVGGNGKALDIDKDGIPDSKDLEPFSELGCKVDASGIMLDADADGVPDCRDEEPNSTEGSIVNVAGVAYKAPKSSGNSGTCCSCSDISLPTIFFSNGSSKISTESYGLLYTVSEKLKQCPTATVNATGYTSSKGNEQLAWKRVNAIVDHLESNYGIERTRINTNYSNNVSGLEYGTRRIDLSSK